jgi:hypothetical protein
VSFESDSLLSPTSRLWSVGADISSGKCSAICALWIPVKLTRPASATGVAISSASAAKMGIMSKKKVRAKGAEKERCQRGKEVQGEGRMQESAGVYTL